MKVFMIAWIALCFLVVVGLFIAYATDNFPGVPAPQQAEIQTDEACSPCEENTKRLKEAMERWERERKAQAVAASDTQ